MSEETKVNQAVETVETEPEVVVTEEKEIEKVEDKVEGVEEVKPEETKDVTFYDANKVPEELKASFVEMQKSFTQKTQEISDVKSKAQLYEDLLKEEWFQEAATTRIKNEKEPETTEEVDPYETESEKKMRERLTKMESVMQEQQVEKELGHLNKLMADETSYPGFKEAIPEIKKVLDTNPKLSYEQAYYQIKGPELSKRPIADKEAIRAQLLKEIEAEKKAGTESGSSTATASVADKQFGMTREGARHYLNEAKKELSK